MSIASFPIASIPISSAPTTSAAVAPTPVIPVVIMPSACYGATTALDIIRRALRAILVDAADSTLEPDEYQDGLDALNDMMAALQAQGIRLGYNRLCHLTDTVSIPDGAIRGVVANLALDLAPQFSGKVTAALIKQASDGMKAMRMLGVRIGQSTLPSTLPTGAGNYRYNVSAFNRAPFATLSMASNPRPNAFTVAADAYKIAGIWSIDKMRGLQADISGRITNTTGEQITVTLDCDFVMVGAGNISRGWVGVIQNGDAVLFAEDALTTDPLVIEINGTLTLDPGDYLEFYVANILTTVGITVTDAIVRVT